MIHLVGLKIIILCCNDHQVASNVQQILAQRHFHASAIVSKSQSGKYKVTNNRSRPLTYEMANPPHFIAHRKSWNSWNTCKHIINVLINLLFPN